MLRDMRRLMSPSALDLREMDFTRAFWAGASWILDNPEMAEASLARAMKAANLLKEGDE